MLFIFQVIVHRVDRPIPVRNQNVNQNQSVTVNAHQANRRTRRVPRIHHAEPVDVVVSHRHHRFAPLVPVAVQALDQLAQQFPVHPLIRLLIAAELVIILVDAQNVPILDLPRAVLVPPEAVLQLNNAVSKKSPVTQHPLCHFQLILDQII